MDVRWYHLTNGQQRGPVDLATMRDLVLDGAIRPDTYVWCEGMPDWMRAREVPALVPPEELRSDMPVWEGVGTPAWEGAEPPEDA